MTRTSGCIIFDIYLRRKGILFYLLLSFRWTPCQNLYMINHYWTTFETLTEIERDCKERQHREHAYTGILHLNKAIVSKRVNERYLMIVSAYSAIFCSLVRFSSSLYFALNCAPVTRTPPCSIVLHVSWKQEKTLYMLYNQNVYIY